MSIVIDMLAFLAAGTLVVLAVWFILFTLEHILGDSP